MKTRFEGKVWITGCGEVIQINDMETDHILNTLKMFIQKPDRTINMMIHDIENSPDVCPFMPWGNNQDDVVNKSIHNITSMSISELISYTLSSNLGKAMCDELTNRGVDVDNYFNVITNLK